MPETKTYTLSNRKQLIDLNGDLTNFDLTFSATSKDGSDFYVVVVDQTTLDSETDTEFDYKKAHGTISGNLISDKGVYQNYFLLLKGDKQCNCDVTIDVKEIPMKQQNHPALPQQKENFVAHGFPNDSKQSVNWKYIFIAIAVICTALLAYMMYNKKMADRQPAESSMFVGESYSPSSCGSPPSATPGSRLDRLNNLAM